MTKKSPYPRPSTGWLRLSVLSLIIVSLISGIVSAETLNIDIDDTQTISDNFQLEGNSVYTNTDTKVLFINVRNVEELRAPFTLILHGDIITVDETKYSMVQDVSLRLGNQNGVVYGQGTMGYQCYPDGTGYIWLDVDSFNCALTGAQSFNIDNSLACRVDANPYNNGPLTDDTPIWFGRYGQGYPAFSGTYTYNTHKEFKQKITLNYGEIDKYSIDKIAVARVIDGKPYESVVEISGKSGVYHQSTSLNAPISVNISSLDRPYKINVFGNSTGIWYNKSALAGEEPTPTQTEEPTVMRTGTVTMTDNNGTSITGFEVTAVNHYTGQEYTVSTDTDVAVMSLPMDRTVRMRNPQTGEYEDTVVGYYRFYGQAPGYKMLNEDGIQVSVLPEKYTSYELCNIRVTSESGYLTGTHQFQIRSRSDNSILQTGTINATSATTGEWYNTTVTDGLASLILPYDTSNSLSPYAGNYAIYATSPGYEDSDFGTQIVVMPHTESEIYDVYLTPIGGVPTAGNVTLRIQAFSETGPGVVNAEIFIVGADGAGESVWDTYIASSTGYLAVSVPGNSTYDIVASGAGFYDSARRVTVYDDDPGLIEIKLYLSGAPTVEPTTQPTGWPTDQPTTQPTGGIPDEDDGSEGFLMQAVRGIGLAFGVGFATAKLIFGMLLALSIGYATAKQLRGGAAEFGLGLLGGTLLGVLIGLLPIWIIVVLLLVVGLYIGNRYVGGGSNNG